jgi:hypothetical protein
MAALSQLSYGPQPPECSRELVLRRPVDPISLIVASWIEPKRDLLVAVEDVHRQEVTGVEVRAVGR